MRNIRLSDGTVYPVDRCGAMEDSLFLNIVSGDSLLALVGKFSDPSGLDCIEHYFDGTTTAHQWYEGYTQLVAASVTRTGVSLTLRKEE